jgi:hypothetical protein
MKQTINFTDFQRAFTDCNREDNFSYEALQALFNWLEEYEEDIGEEIELDVIEICCEFTEYENLEELQERYTDIESLEDLHLYTQVIELDNGGLVIQDF